MQIYLIYLVVLFKTYANLKYKNLFYKQIYLIIFCWAEHCITKLTLVLCWVKLCLTTSTSDIWSSYIITATTISYTHETHITQNFNTHSRYYQHDLRARLLTYGQYIPLQLESTFICTFVPHITKFTCNGFSRLTL